MPRHAGRIAPVAAVVLVLLTAIYSCSPNFMRPEDDQLHPIGGDLLQEWVGGWMIRNGQADRLYDTAHFDQLQHAEQLVGFRWDPKAYLPAVYPPYYYWLVSPLAQYPFLIAIWIWAGLLVASLLLGWTLLVTARSPRGDELTRGGIVEAGCSRWPLWWTWGFAAILVTQPVIESLTSSQKGPLLLLVLAIVYSLMVRGQHFMAGLACGLLACKPQWLLVLLPWIVWRTDRWFLAGMASTIALLCGVAWLLSPAACLDYLEFLAGSADYIRTAGYEQHLARSACWHGAWSLLFGPGTIAARSATALSVAWTLLIVAHACRHRPRVDDPQFSDQFAIVVIATCLVNPHLFAYDLTVLIVPLVLWISTRSAAGLQRIELWWPALGLFAITGLSSEVAAVTGINISVAWMAWWLWIWSRRSARQWAEAAPVYGVELSECAAVGGRG